MIPLVVLVSVTLAVRALGALTVPWLDDWSVALRLGLAAMLLLTGSAHFGSRREDLIRMVPGRLPRPDLLVTATGIAELAIAVGLLFEASAPLAAALLIPLLVAMFPANVRAARERIPIGGRAPMPLCPRAIVQGLFIACAWMVLAR